MPIFRLIPRKSSRADRNRLLRPYRQFIARLKRARNKLGQVALRRGERLARVRAFLREAARAAGVNARLSRDGKAITVTLRVGRRRRRRRAAKAPAGGRAAARSARRRARRRTVKRGPVAAKGRRAPKATEAGQKP